MSSNTARYSLETLPHTVIFDHSSTHCTQVLHAMQSTVSHHDITRATHSEHLAISTCATTKVEFHNIDCSDLLAHH